MVQLLKGSVRISFYGIPQFRDPKPILLVTFHPLAIQTCPVQHSSVDNMLNARGSKITDVVSGRNSGQDSKLLNKRISLRLKSRVEGQVAEGESG